MLICYVKLTYILLQLSYLRTVRQEASKLKNRNANYTTCRPISSRTNGTSSPKSQSVNYIELKASSQTIELVQVQDDSSASMNGPRQPPPSFAESKPFRKSN